MVINLYELTCICKFEEPYTLKVFAFQSVRFLYIKYAVSFKILVD